MENQKPATQTEETNLVVMPEITQERSIWSLMQSQANALFKSGMLPNGVKSPEAALAIIQTGREFGLQPMESFRNIHIINGRPTLAAQLMAGRVNRWCAKRGGYMYQVELSEQRCVIEYKRPEWPAAQTFSFSMEDAKRAELLGKDNWKRHPREMMYNRAVSNACRMGWPELVAGVYDPDELDAPTYMVEQVDADGTSPSVSQFATANEPRVYADDRERANARYFAVIAAKGLTDDERKALQRIAYQVGSAKQMNADQLRQLADRIEQRTIEELRDAIERQREIEAQATQEQQGVPDYSDHDPASPIPDFLERIRKAKTEQELNAVTQEMQAIGVWDAAVTPAVVAKRNELGLPAPKPTPARTVNDIVDQAPLVPDGEPGLDRHSS